MPLPTASTIVTYPAGDLASIGTVLHVEPHGEGRTAVVLDRTAFHAVDAAWPDQGPDRGTLAGKPVVDAIVGATDGEALYIGGDVPVRKGAAGWAFVVMHVIEGTVAVGDTVEVRVDSGYRTAISRGHTACHLASLALNHALSGAWTKEVPLDSAGQPNFDALAIETSTIAENASVDVYRVGKSLRKKGFSVAALDDLAAVESAANARLSEFVRAGVAITVECDGPGLDDRRYWVCGDHRIPCGGTHVHNTADLGDASITLVRSDVDGAITLVMETTAN